VKWPEKACWKKVLPRASSDRLALIFIFSYIFRVQSVDQWFLLAWMKF
jgi:hypothetical protein